VEVPLEKLRRKREKIGFKVGMVLRRYGESAVIFDYMM